MVANTLSKEIVQELVKQLVKALNPLAIYILAPQDSNTCIDFNVLLVVDKTPLDHFNLKLQARKALTNLDFGKIISVYSAEEFTRYANSTWTLCHLVQTQGTCVYTQDSTQSIDQIVLSREESALKVAGAHEKQLEIAKQLLNEFSAEKVAAITGLSLIEVKTLKPSEPIK